MHLQNQDSMETLGKKLKSARKTKGLTVEALSEKTKINRDFIAAMERDDFAFLPRPYVRGFLRQVAAAVGVDPDEAVSVLESLSQGAEESADTPAQEAQQEPPTQSQSGEVDAGRVKTGSEGRSRSGRKGRQREAGPKAGASPAMPADAAAPVAESPIGPPIPAQAAGGGRRAAPTGTLAPSGKRLEWLLGTAAAVVGLAILLIYISYNRSVSRDAAQPVQELPLETALQPADSSAEAWVEPEPQNLQLQVMADQATWMRVVIDDRDTSEVTLRQGQSKTWEATRRFGMRFGNAGGVRLLLNGRDLGRPGRSGQVVSITVSREGIVNRRVYAPRRAQPDSVASVDPGAGMPLAADVQGIGGRHGTR